MEAAHITWRPLGQLFVERGLITQDELEEALVEQQETRKRLGAILIARGLVSGPELTSVLVDQLGMELTKESGFGSGLWDEIRRRHPRGTTDSEPSGNGEAPHPADEPEESGDFEPDESDDDRDWAALEVALEEERTGRQQALEELLMARAEATSRAAELSDLSGQVSDLRSQIRKSTAAVAAVGQISGLESRITELENALVAEQAKSRAVAAELDSARSEAGVAATELRGSIDRFRGELEQIEAATAWLEYWSKAEGKAP